MPWFLTLILIGVLVWIGLGWLSVRQVRSRFDPQFLQGDWIEYDSCQFLGSASARSWRPTPVPDETVPPIARWVPKLHVHELPHAPSTFRVPTVAVGADAAFDVLFTILGTTQVLHMAKHSMEQLLRVDLDLFSAHDVLTGVLMESPVAVLLHVKEGVATSAPDFVARLFDGSLTHTAEQWFAAHIAGVKLDSVIPAAQSAGHLKDALLTAHVPVPFATILIVSIRDLRLVHRSCLSLDQAIANVAVATVSVGTGIVIGKLIGGIVGAPLGPAGIVLGSLGGAVIGGMGGRSVAESIRRERLKSAQHRLTVGIERARERVKAAAAEGEDAIRLAKEGLRVRVLAIERQCRAAVAVEAHSGRERCDDALRDFHGRFPEHLKHIDARLRAQERESSRSGLAWRDVLWPSTRLGEYWLRRVAFKRARRRLRAVGRTYASRLSDATFAADEFITSFFERYQTAEPNVVEDMRQLEATCRAALRDVDQAKERLSVETEREVQALVAAYRSTGEIAQLKVASTTREAATTLERLRDEVRKEARALGLEAA